MIVLVTVCVCLIVYGIFYSMARTYRCSSERISNRVIQLYTNIINNPAWYDKTSYFAATITSTSLAGNVYTAQITAYGDGNTSVSDLVYNKDWISYTMPDCDTYNMVDARIGDIAPLWSRYVNTGAYFIRLLHKQYITYKIEFATRVGLGNAFYTITASRFVRNKNATGFRLYYSYNMSSNPPVLVLPSMFSRMAYVPCVASCMNAGSNMAACYLANVAAAKKIVTQPDQPMIWELAGSADVGEDYIDIDMYQNVLGGQFTYWGNTFVYDPTTIDHILVGMNNFLNYLYRKKLNCVVQFLRSGLTESGSWAKFRHADGTIGKETYDAFGQFVS